MVMAEDTALEGLTTVDVAELQARCQELVDQAVSSRDPLVLISDGRPIACLARYLEPAQAFYVRPSPDGNGAIERVYCEVVETLHRNVTVAELQAQSPALVEQTATNNWRVLVWNSSGPDAMLTRYVWRSRRTSPATVVGGIDWDVGEAWNATLDGDPSPDDSL